MKRVLHQCRADLHRFRVLIVVWWTVLAADLAILLAGLGAPGFADTFRVGLLSRWAADGMVLIMVLFPWLFASLVVLVDSTGRGDRFLATRPMPRGDLWLAKGLFLVLVIVLPMALQEALHLISRGLPAILVVHGVAERFAGALMAVLVAASFSSIWPGGKVWVVGLGAAVLAGTIVGLIWMLLPAFLFRAPTPGDPHFSQFLATVVSFGVLTAVLAIAVARRPWSEPKRFVASAGAGAVALFMGLVLPWDPFSPRGQSPGRAREVVARDTVEVPLPRLGVFPAASERADVSASAYDVGFVPRSTSRVPGEVVNWWCESGRLVAEDGTTLDLSATRLPPRVLSWSSRLAGPEFGVLVGELATNAVWLRGPLTEGGDHSDYVYAGRLNLAGRGAVAGRPAQLHIRIGGHVFRWEKAAELPLAAGATHRGAIENWSVVRSVDVAAASPMWVLKARRVALHTTTDTRLTAAGNWPSDRYLFVVFDPEQREATVASFAATVLEKGGLSACRDAYVLVNFPPQSPSDASSTSRPARTPTLVIYHRAYLGSSLADWESPAFRLAETSPQPYSDPPQERIPRTLAASGDHLMSLAAPSSGASRAELGQFVLAVLDDVAATPDISGYLEAIAAGRLADYVPTHLDLFLEGARLLPETSRRVLLRAISEGATADQRHAILQALPRTPALAEVALSRGWMTEAEDSVRTWTHRPGSLPLCAVQALASLEDPATYPRLIAELEASPSPDLYRVLDKLAGIQPPLDRAVRRIWGGDRLRIPTRPSGDWVISLAHGVPEALTSILRFQQSPPAPELGDEGTRLMWVRALRDVVATDDLTPAQRHDDARFQAWLIAHRDAPFVFDKARRLFVPASRSTEVP